MANDSVKKRANKGLAARGLCIALAAAALAACAAAGGNSDRELSRREQAEIQRSVPMH